MKIIESSKIKEKAYIEKLESGLTIIIVPKQGTKKKYVIWGTHFGSIDYKFIEPNTNEEVVVPDGIAHFLEHKMFEQKSGINSLDTLMALGVDANAYTTNDHTAYLFESTDNFYEALDELMDYVQNPYYTDENVEKEKGIIAQEIKMYDDDPSWQLYMNALDCLYKENPIKIDVAGSVESISGINKELLYKCYNTFYNPANMVLVVSGDFKPEEILEEIKSRLIPKEVHGEIKRFYPEREVEINKKHKETEMEVSKPLFMIGFKDINKAQSSEEAIKKHIAIEILLNMLCGKSSKLYKKMYDEGNLLSQPDLDYEFTDLYAHILISGQANDPQKFQDEFNKTIKEYKENFDENHFSRIKKKVYGDYVCEYNNVGDIARMFLADYFKGLNAFDYIEQYDTVTPEYTKQVLTEVFDEKNEIMSIINPK